MKRITDPTFKYVESGKTDIAATFRRIRRQIAEQAERDKVAEQERVVKVSRIRGERK